MAEENNQSNDRNVRCSSMSPLELDVLKLLSTKVVFLEEYHPEPSTLKIHLPPIVREITRKLNDEYQNQFGRGVSFSGVVKEITYSQICGAIGYEQNGNPDTFQPTPERVEEVLLIRARKQLRDLGYRHI
jgi:hypothetical protein